MKITILNGNPNAVNAKFDNYLKELSGLPNRLRIIILKNKGHVKSSAYCNLGSTKGDYT